MEAIPTVTEQTTVPGTSADDLPEQMRVRREKRDRLLAEGVEPYPVGVPRTGDAWPRSGRATPTCPPTPPPATRSSVTGRVMFIRNTGKLCFATLREGDGTELQAMLSLDRVGAERAGGLEAPGRPR